MIIKESKHHYPRIRSKKTLADRSFMFVATQLWNNLPADIRNTDDLSNFKSKLKTHLLLWLLVDQSPIIDSNSNLSPFIFFKFFL